MPEIYVSEAERDTRWPLFNKRFMCRVPNMATRSVDHIKIFGTPYSGDPRFDKQMANEVIDRYLTIVDMVAYHKDGITIAVVNYKDTEKIYDIISNHLDAWKVKLDNDLGRAPAQIIEDLTLLDKFADVVYAKARFLKRHKTFIESAFTQAIESTRMAPDVLMPYIPSEEEKKAAAGRATVEEIAPGDDLPKRMSMAEVFASARVGPKKASMGAGGNTAERNQERQHNKDPDSMTSNRW